MRKPYSASHSVVKSIFCENSCEIISVAVTYGICMESVAREKYHKLHKVNHKKLHVRECGLIVNGAMPHLGASPDGLVSCKCCGHGLLEIKCSYKYRQSTVNQIAQKGDYHVKIGAENKSYLNPSSPWYTQIQGQLAIAELQWCDFVLYTDKDLFVERIYFDRELWLEIKRNCDNFYNDIIVPKLLME